MLRTESFLFKQSALQTPERFEGSDFYVGIMINRLSGRAKPPEESDQALL